MNCPSRTEEPVASDGFNQNPPALAADLTTRADLNEVANGRMLKRAATGSKDEDGKTLDRRSGELGADPRRGGDAMENSKRHVDSAAPRPGPGPRNDASESVGVAAVIRRGFQDLGRTMVNFGKFVGPGFMISVAYIDPGNYSTDVAAGATYRYKLLFVVLMSNIFAIVLQSLCIKLGSVSGLNLAEACRAYLPKWLNICLYILAEVAIIATDIAEVIGTAIAINLLIPKIPLVAGCALSIGDVLLILLFYNPNGSMRGLRAFEVFVIFLVLGVVICFCIQLSLIENTSAGEVFHGFLPSSAIVQSQGLYQACGILGATVMPHSLYLGSGIVQARLKEYDVSAGNVPASIQADSATKLPYIPSLSAINFCLNYSIAELAISLFTFALFVNSAILIVAGASLSSISSAASADLFGIYHLLSTSLAPAAGTIFALALLLSGISAGIVCTIAGQMVSEGALNWSITPWVRRLLTRSISITPSIIIAGAVGRDGLTAALNGSQVVLSVVLPFVSAPLVYFTCRNKYMTVRAAVGSEDEGQNIGLADAGDGVAVERGERSRRREGTKMRNHWVTATVAVLIWLVITIMNVANLVLLGKGQGA